ncbi:hypothetical protein Tco_0302693 [Tanacetum coccineum]
MKLVDGVDEVLMLIVGVDRDLSGEIVDEIDKLAELNGEASKLINIGSGKASAGLAQHNPLSLVTPSSVIEAKQVVFFTECKNHSSSGVLSPSKVPFCFSMNHTSVFQASVVCCLLQKEVIYQQESSL